MKKLMICLMLCLLLPFAALAETDLTALSAQELTALRSQINAELASRTPVPEASATDDFLYASNGEEVHIKAYYGSEANVVIPETIDGCPVTAIDDQAFKGNAKLVTITFPSRLNSIGDSAFSGCKGLTTATFSQTMTGKLTIGKYAFSGCTALTTISFPRSRLESLIIRYEAFDDAKLSDVLVLNADYIFLGYSSFRTCSKVTGVILLADQIVFQDSPIPRYAEYVYMSPDATASYSGYFANSTTGDVFPSMPNLKAVYMPNSVTFITRNTFANTPHVVMYCQADSPAIEAARPYFIPMNTKHYESRSNEILTIAAELGFIW